MAETSRAEAVAKAAGWAAEADRCASYTACTTKQAEDHRAARDQARDMALMWTKVAALLREDICAERAPSLGPADDDHAYPDFCTLPEGHRSPWHHGEKGGKWRKAEPAAGPPP